MKPKEFKCLHCHLTVYTDSSVSGVQNRNHCPYCLWSRHVDLEQAGDRLAACQGMMRPVGLTMKRTRKKYGVEKQGELMLIHICVGCGKASINRIAADDDAEKVFEIYQGYAKLDPATRTRLEESGIIALQASDKLVVQAQLFGIK